MKKDNLVDHVPVPYKISEWGNPPEIVYSCPKCGETFHFYSDQEKFCHNCGHKIYWDTCNRYLNPEQEKDIEKSKDNILIRPSLGISGINFEINFCILFGRNLEKNVNKIYLPLTSKY